MSRAPDARRALRVLPSSFIDLARPSRFRGVVWLVPPALMLGLTATMLFRMEAEADELARREYQAQQALLVDHAASQLGATLDRTRLALERVARDPDARRSFAASVGAPVDVWRVGSTSAPLRIIGEAEGAPEGAHQLTVSRRLGPDASLVAVLDASALHDWLFSEMSRDHDGYVWVMDDWGAIVSAPRAEDVGSRPFDALDPAVERSIRPTLDAMMRDERGVTSYLWKSGDTQEERLAAYAPVPGHPEVAVAHSVSASSVSARTRALHTTGRAFLLTLLAVFAGLALLAVRRARRHAQSKLARALQLGQYTLEEQLGEGGMGVVHRARHAFLRRPTAIKLISPEKVGEAAIRRFEAEAQALARLRHPSTVTLYDYGRSEDGVFYYAMELLDGYDLDELLSRTGPVPLERLVPWLQQLLGALAEAHGLGLVHRDVKPSNLMVCHRGRGIEVAKLLDFGLVTSRGASGRDGRFVVGTPMYLAPEVVSDPTRIDERVDLYALGATAYELATGRPPFDTTDLHELVHHHLVTLPEPPSTHAHRLPPSFDTWVLRCLAKEPAARFRSAVEAAGALESLGVEPWGVEAVEAWWARSFGTPPVPPSKEVASAETLDADVAAMLSGQ